MRAQWNETLNPLQKKGRESYTKAAHTLAYTLRGLCMAVLARTCTQSTRAVTVWRVYCVPVDA